MITHSLISTITGCVSIFAFTSLVVILYRNCKFYNRLKMCVITAGIKKYKSIIKKTRKRHDKMVLLAKSKLNSKKVLIISKALIDSKISHDEFVLIMCLKNFIT